MEFDNWYRNKIESSQEEPPQALWEEIQDDLDLAQVWNRLEGELHPAQSSRNKVFWSIAASVAFLIAVGIWQFLPQQGTQSPLGYQMLSPRWPNELNIRTQHHGPIKEVHQRATDTRSYSASFQGDRDVQPGEPAAHQPVALAELQTSEPLGKLQRMLSLKAQPPVIPSPAPAAVIGFTEPTPLLVMETSPKTLSFLSLGVTGEFANTWQVNAKTLRGMQKSELTSTHASFVNNLGLVARASLSPAMSLRADFRFSAQSRQDYHEYIDGKYLATSLELDYAILSVMLSRRLGAFHSPHWLSAGLYTGHLKQAHQSFEGNLLTVKDQYSNTDFGIMAGYEYRVPVWKQVYVATGLFTRYGLLNAYSGNQQIPDYMNRTRNAALVFSVSVNYSLK